MVGREARSSMKWSNWTHINKEQSKSSQMKGKKSCDMQSIFVFNDINRTEDRIYLCYIRISLQVGRRRGAAIETFLKEAKKPLDPPA